MFGYVSVAQLTQDVREGLWRIPADVDLVVGIPRSGMIPAYLIGLYVNRLVTDLEAFLANSKSGHGRTRKVGATVSQPQEARHILLVDDSIGTGISIRTAVEKINAVGYRGRITTCAAIVSPEQAGTVDIAFRELPFPRLFEWNALHHAFIERSCFDLDGVLCVDPAAYDDDDGPRYLNFLTNAVPLFRPTRRIGHIVSARLERYRSTTEEWLAKVGIEYSQLHLLDLPSKAERIRLRPHAAHKAAVYRSTGSMLFYESDPGQAQEIARLSGKPVLCVYDMRIYLPQTLDIGVALAKTKWRIKIPYSRLKRWAREQRRRMAAEP